MSKNRKKGQLQATLLRSLLAAAGDGLGALRNRLRRGGNRRTGAHRRDRVAVPDVGGQARAALQHGAGGATASDEAGGVARFGALRAFAAWVVPVVVAVGAFATPLLGVRAYEYVMTSGHFQVHEVLIAGNRRLDYETLRQTLGVEAGTHLLASDVDAMQARCEAHPWVSWCRVDKELPDRLVVELVEHEPAAYLALGELMLVNRAGEAFAPADGGLGASLRLPIITGVEAGALADPARRPETEARVRGAINVMRLYDTMGLTGRWPVGEVRLDAVRGLTLVISPVGTEAVLGHGPYRDKLFRLEWVLESLHQEGKTAEYIVLDAYGAEVDGRVVVKADLAPASEAMMDQATARAREAERSALGLPPDPDLFGPAVAPALLGGGADAGDEDAPLEGPATPALTGGRPALEPNDLNADGEAE